MGLDNPGQPTIMTVDMCAGDEECDETFAAVYQPILAKKHLWYSEEAGHRTDLDASKIDREGQHASYVESITVQAKRNLAGVRFTTAASLEERVEVERALIAALLQLTEDLEGSYLPLEGSRTYAGRPQDSFEEDAETMEDEGLFFRETDSKLLLSSGMGRHWPQARGVLVDAGHTCTAHMNNEEHLQLIVQGFAKSHISEVFERFCKFESATRLAHSLPRARTSRSLSTPASSRLSRRTSAPAASPQRSSWPCASYRTCPSSRCWLRA